MDNITFPQYAAGAASILYDQGVRNIRVIGDVHADLDSLKAVMASAPENTYFLLLGDIVDYGPQPKQTFDFIYDMLESGRGIMVWGNHDYKLWRVANSLKTTGVTNVVVKPGSNDITLNEIYSLPDAEKSDYLDRILNLQTMVRRWIRINSFHFVHGAYNPIMDERDNQCGLPRGDTYADSMAIYGESSGIRPDGLPDRTYNWANKLIPGQTVVIGHDIISKEKPLIWERPKGSRVIFLDTGCGKGGKLSHLDLTLTEDPEFEHMISIVPNYPPNTFGQYEEI